METRRMFLGGALVAPLAKGLLAQNDAGLELQAYVKAHGGHQPGANTSRAVTSAAYTESLGLVRACQLGQLREHHVDRLAVAAATLFSHAEETGYNIVAPEIFKTEIERDPTQLGLRRDKLIGLMPPEIFPQADEIVNMLPDLPPLEMSKVSNLFTHAGLLQHQVTILTALGHQANGVAIAPASAPRHSGGAIIRVQSSTTATGGALIGGGAALTGLAGVVNGILTAGGTSAGLAGSLTVLGLAGAGGALIVVGIAVVVYGVYKGAK